MRQYVKKYKVDSLTWHFYLTRRSWIILSLQSGPYVPVPLVLQLKVDWLQAKAYNQSKLLFSGYEDYLCEKR